MNEYRENRGAGMIEVLIALLLFSLGFNGMNALQLQAHRVGMEAQQRAAALALAEDLFARVRSNPRQLMAFHAAEVGAAAVAATADCREGYCNPVQFAAWDLARWTDSLRGAAASSGAAGLANGRACLMAAGNRLRLTIAWRGQFADAAPVGGGCATDSGLFGAGDVFRRELQIASYIGGDV